MIAHADDVPPLWEGPELSQSQINYHMLLVRTANAPKSTVVQGQISIWVDYDHFAGMPGLLVWP